MIDIENKVYNDVAQAIRQKFGRKYPNLSMYSEYEEVPSSFPCVTLVEENNSRLASTDDGSKKEHYARVMYSCNIYTNNTDKKALGKSIADTVDEVMSNIGFTRLVRTQIPNIDRTIYRITLRYEGIVDEGITVDNKKIHTIYKV